MQKWQLNKMFEASNEFGKMGNTELLKALSKRVAKVDVLNSVGMSIPSYNYSIKAYQKKTY